MKKKVVPKMAQVGKSSADEIKRYLDIANKDAKKHRDAINKDTKRYIGALAEDFQGRVSAIAEQFSGVNARLDGVDKKLEVHTQMIGQLMVDVQEIKTDMKQKVERSEFSRLEKRVIALELRPRATAQRK